VNIPDNINWPNGLDAQTFLNDFWQKKPLLIRQAFVDFETPITPDELAGLSLEEDTTPRLITCDSGGQYHLENGPFKEDRFGQLSDNNWSLLVTDVEKHLPDLAQYLCPFQFIPNWRIDDLMISYAPNGASVGAHVDEYDVFLLQASGNRQWMIDSSDNPDVSLVPDATLKLLANFVASDTYDLEPGDMLYLPPGMPHHGIAISDNCTTWSVGFRAPTVADTVHAFAEIIADKLESQRYKDPALTVCEPGKIDKQSLDAFKTLWQNATKLHDDDVANIIGRLLTVPAIDIERGEYNEQEKMQHQWRKHSFSRFAYTQQYDVTTLYADGDVVDCSAKLAIALCNNQSVTADELDANDTQVLMDLIDLGCLTPDEDYD